ncbi:MAG: Arylsulfatase [Bacilli bacterium]|nr:Arylsulfatase [Bacilli bacterium]
MQSVLKRIAQSLKYILSRVHLLVLPLLLLGYFEYLCRGNASNTVGWIRGNILIFILNYLLVLALLLLFAAIAGRTWMAYTALSAVLVVIGFISGVKMKFLGVPLMPWDIVLSKETGSMTTYLHGILDKGLLGFTVLFIALSFGLLKFVPNFNVKFKWPEKVVFLAFAVFVGFCIYSNKPIDLKDRFHISNISYDQATNYRTNGYLVTTSINIKLVFIPVPTDYNEQNMKAIVDNVPRRTNIDPNVKPNIIVILSEAFWDPTLLPNVTFDHDPVPNLHQLMKTYSSGMMLSPQFGGGTANVEFEVLSGNSMRFTPPGSTPYIQYFNHGIDSMASILRRQGYTTTAINPYYNWFFNSKNVYKDFGFSQFISMEFFQQNIKGYNIADSEVTKNIIAQTERTPGTDFIFANTMENHFPFYPGKFKENTFKVSGNVSDSTKGILETYATGAADADLMLKNLVDHYTETKEPTIVVFFGDHKPVLGSNYGVYTDTGYFKPNDSGRLKKMYDVPVVVWNNYLPQHKDNLDISPSFLGPYVLNLAKKEGTPYMDYLYALSQKDPIIPPSFYYDGFNIKAADLIPYQLMQYDMMFGKQFLMQQVKDPIVDPSFKLGFGSMVIDSVSPAHISAGVALQQGQNGSTLTVSGQNFVQESRIYLNDKMMATKLTADGKLTTEVPMDIYKKAGSIVVEVKVKDSENIVISDSNQIVIDVK